MKDKLRGTKYCNSWQICRVCFYLEECKGKREAKKLRKEWKKLDAVCDELLEKVADNVCNTLDKTISEIIRGDN